MRKKKTLGIGIIIYKDFVSLTIPYLILNRVLAACRERFFLLLLFCFSNSLFSQKHTVIINEMMIDPTPTVRLPNAEYIELKNVSDSSVNVFNYSITDQTKTAKLPSYILPKDSCIILCSSTNASAFSVYGKTFGLANFPSLNNDKDTLILYNAQQQIIHSLTYDETWFKNSIKQDGGWSLELIDGRFPFAESANWGYSIDKKGGTPGKENSIKNNQPDTTSLELLSYEVRAKSIMCHFNKAISPAFIQTQKSILFKNKTPQIDSIILVKPLYKSFVIYVAKEFQEDIIYDLQILWLIDLSQLISKAFNISFGLPSPIKQQDIIINEVLFNPLAYENRFIELYNNSNHIFDLSELYFATVKNNALENIVRVSNQPRYFFPKTFVALTPNIQQIAEKYPSADKTNLIGFDMPSLSNDSSCLIIANRASDTIDKMCYSKLWHYPNLPTIEGVSLEKIYYTLNGTEKANWYSSAYPYYGTPTKENSQFKQFPLPASHFALSTSFLSPNGDGNNDFVLLRYQFSRHDISFSIKIFSLQGDPVCTIANGTLAGIDGQLLWAGTNDSNNVLASGNYIILVHYFDTEGHSNTEKFFVTLAL